MEVQEMSVQSAGVAERTLPVGEFGTPTEWVPRSAINVLPQIRSKFDQVALLELADSIHLIDAEQATGKPRYDLLEALIEGRHDETSARRYLSQFNHVNGTSLSLEDFKSAMTPEGERWYFHIAGERRLRAGDIIIERDGLSPDSVFQCTVAENPEYIEALPKQFIENNARVNPPPQDEAKAIRNYYNAMKELAEAMGRRFTNRECAKAFAVNPDKVADAITFTDYPQEMQDLVERYPYSMVVGAKELYEAWKKYHLKVDDPGLSEAQRDEFIATVGKAGFSSLEAVAACEVETSFELLKAERLRQRQRPDGAKRDLSIKKQTENVLASINQHSLGFMQGLLDVPSDPDNYWSRRKLAAGSLYKAAMDALIMLDELNMLTDDMRAELGRRVVITEVIGGSVRDQVEPHANHLA